MGQIDSKMSAGTMAGNNDVDDGWVYLEFDGDQETKASAVPAPDDAATEVLAATDVVGDGAVDDADAAEDEDGCSYYSNEGRREKSYESDQDLDQVDDESEHEHGTSDLRLRELLDNLKTIEKKLLDCQRELEEYCQKSIQDLRKATRDEAAPAPAPAPAPSADCYNARYAAAIAELYASMYRGGVYSGKSSGYGYGYGGGGYGTSSGYDGNGYGGGGYYGGLSDYDYGGDLGGYHRGISGYDYGGLGYYYYPGISDSKYGIGGGGGYGSSSGYRYGGGGGYGGISDYGYRYGRGGGHYSDFHYGGLGDRYSGSSANNYGYRPEDYGHLYRGDDYLGSWMYWRGCKPGAGMYPAQPAGSQYGYMDMPYHPSSPMPGAPAAEPEALPMPGAPAAEPEALP